MRIATDIANVIVDPASYQAAAPVDEAFTAIRAATPFEIAQPDGYDPFWVASKHADIIEIERRPDVFKNGLKGSVLATRDASAMVRNITGGSAHLIHALVGMDGREHRDLRGITFPSFAPASVRKLEGDIRSIAREFVDKLLDRGPECDFAKEVAFLYPLRVLMKMLGIPQEDEPLMLQLTQEIFSSGDPELNRTGAEVSPSEMMNLLHQAMLELEAYFGKLTSRLRANPEDNVNSLIANARIGDAYLTDRQLMGYYIITATAGHDTTSNATAGSMWKMAETTGMLERIKADAALIPPFLEETVRWFAPVKHFMRTAAEDTEVRGRKVEKDDWIMLSYHSANRDEAAFDDPFTFDIARRPNKQIAFGYGPHACLGQHLARMEMRLLWEELLPRLKSVELAGLPKLTRSNFVCGPKSVPIRFDAA